MKKRNKSLKKQQNLFDIYGYGSLVFTNHFYDRWIERVDKDKTRNDIFLYITKQHISHSIKHLDSDYYLVEDVMFIAKEDNDKIILISTIGRISDNFIIYNTLINYGAKKLAYYTKNYGKLKIS